jgi:serine/threonine-protein kinase RsbW
MTLNKHLSFQIPATSSAVDDLCRQVKVWLSERNLEQEHFPVDMLLRESLNNAVLHGCCSDATQQIRCELEREGNWLRIAVEDPGSGFDWQFKLDCPMCTTDCHGRGLKILSLYADEITFNPRGNRVVLRRRITGGP